MELSERFWSAELHDLKKGYAYDETTESFICLICGEAFEDGAVYKVPEMADRLYEARKFAGYHVQAAHGSVLSYLLSLDKKATGLTDLQKDLIRDFASGLSDNEIVSKAGSGSASTIRNHRFVLKEKAKQAKLMLAIMDLMEGGASLEVPRFVPVHKTATQIDERYAITEEEYGSWMSKYFPEGPKGPLASFPRKEKRKIAVLRHIASFFLPGRQYTEKEMNDQLKVFWEEDYVTLRRYLIEYGYVDRTDDGSAYWLKV